MEKGCRMDWCNGTNCHIAGEKQIIKVSIHFKISCFTMASLGMALTLVRGLWQMLALAPRLKLRPPCLISSYKLEKNYQPNEGLIVYVNTTG